MCRNGIAGHSTGDKELTLNIGTRVVDGTDPVSMLYPISSLAFVWYCLFHLSMIALLDPDGCCHPNDGVVTHASLCRQMGTGCWPTCTKMGSCSAMTK